MLTIKEVKTVINDTYWVLFYDNANRMSRLTTIIAEHGLCSKWYPVLAVHSAFHSELGFLGINISKESIPKLATLGNINRYLTPEGSFYKGVLVEAITPSDLYVGNVMGADFDRNYFVLTDTDHEGVVGIRQKGPSECSTVSQSSREGPLGNLF